MNDDLQKAFTRFEVEEALSHMAPLKSPSPDGFGAIFYQSYWKLVGDQISSVVLEFLNRGILPPSLNSTFLALIAKVQNPSSVNEFRPISLCNILYKLIAKTLANRLKRVLPSIISWNHSAFILGRLTSDNIIVAYEALHSIFHQMQGRVGNMAIKPDISKAYDRVEWSS